MATATVVAVSEQQDEGYDQLEALLRQRIAAVKGPVFTTDASPDELWRAYLEGIPADRRQHYNCHCCRNFIQRFGGLVQINPDAQPLPLLWSMGEHLIPEFFQNSVAELYAQVRQAKVSGVYLWDAKGVEWGTAQAGGWSHLSGKVSFAPHTDRTKTASQAAADKKQDYQILCQAVVDYPAELVVQAVRVLESDSVYRAEKALGIAKWFSELHNRIAGVKGKLRQNLLWLAAAEAPVGFCHLRSTMISTLLDDLKEGLEFSVVQKRWAAKMHPLQYQRPTAAPSEGAIKQAEKVFEQMGAASALRRRYAKLEDVLNKLWVPVVEQPKEEQGSLFGHLKPKPKPVEVELPEQAITFDKFRRTVLPEALSMEVDLGWASNSLPLYGLLTAVDPEAVPILQWDGLEGHPRNPVNHYFYNGGSSPQQWGLSSGWCEVTAVFPNPAHWQQPEKFKHQAQHWHFALKGAVDSRSEEGLCLFPEVLRPEFHPVRSVIEAYNRTKQREGRTEATANGIAFSDKPLRVRVRSRLGRAVYRIDRMD